MGEGEPPPSNKKARYRRAGVQALSCGLAGSGNAGADRKESPEGRTQGDRNDALVLSNGHRMAVKLVGEQCPIGLADTRTGQRGEAPDQSRGHADGTTRGRDTLANGEIGFSLKEEKMRLSLSRRHLPLQQSRRRHTN